MMVKCKFDNRKIVLASLIVFCAICAMPYMSAQGSEPKMVFHSFSFGTPGIPESPGVKVLNFQYGDSKITGTYVDNYWLAKGQVGQGIRVGGVMPVGDFLYVKWRDLASGEVYEDRVDLRDRLPTDMDHKNIHFTIEKRKLHIYVIEDQHPTVFHDKTSPNCGALSYSDYRCTEIYPDFWKNF